MPKAVGGGVFGEPFSDLIVACPGEACTETFLAIGPFRCRKEADNCAAYFRTKFFRAMLSIRKITQNATADAYGFVPLVDLTRRWTDSDLYAKYELSETERAFIEDNVEPMK